MILNNEQLRARARTFALTHEIKSRHFSASNFWPAFRLDVNRLHAFADRLTRQRASCVQPAEDWLLDHIAFIETQAQDVHRVLTPKVLRTLPTLRNNGMPRIYAICDDYLEHVDGHYEVASFVNYVRAYQDVTVLQVGECWLLPAAMRVVIMRRLANVMREVEHRHNVCDRIVELLGQLGSRPMNDAQIRTILDRESRRDEFTATEVVHFVRHLSEWEPDIRAVRAWLAAHVDNSAESLEQMVSYEHQLQADLQVTSGNLVESLHRLERHPWEQSFTSLCKVEQILRTDTGPGPYVELDDSSRTVLRNRVVDLARQMRVPETLVAQTAVKLAEQRQFEFVSGQVPGSTSKVKSEFPPSRNTCLSYYLLDGHGVKAMRLAISHQARPRRLPQAALQRRPLGVYLTSAAVIFAMLMLLAAGWVTSGITLHPWAWVAVFGALLLPMSQWTLTLMHTAISRCCRPTPLLRYDFSKGLPADARTMVVMPIIWSNVSDVDDVMDRLLVHAMANREKNIHFAVLADYTDAPTATLPTDAELLEHAVNRIRELQGKYGSDKFFLFHRDRRYNETDNIYMGWERKRGKLVEFAELLAGDEPTSYTTVCGETRLLGSIRYVFTADHDTRLPIGVVQRMAGTIHLPYNQPRFNAKKTRIVEGFGVLQPRIGMSFDSTQKSRFAALWASEPGIDVYAFAAANPYQDLFGQGMFVGKGIFDVHAFRTLLAKRIPDNRILSHDVLEGGFLRAGLVSDVEVVEDQPSTFYAHQSRAHRWIRGDWQLLPWLGRSCKDRTGLGQPIDLCGLTRWQIIDSLRNSLMTPALFVIAVLGLQALPGRVAVWEGIVLLTLFLPFLLTLIRWRPLTSRWQSVQTVFWRCVVQCMTLPFQAVVAADAIVRTLYRQGISRRRLLEWTPAAQAERAGRRRPSFLYTWPGYGLSLVFVAVAWDAGWWLPQWLAFFGLVLFGLAYPTIHALNQPPTRKMAAWRESCRHDLLSWAGQIWAYYDKYVTEEHNWLPPDNVQFHPKETVANRTSPTNIGLYLTCVIAAHDLGFIRTQEMLQRLDNTLNAIDHLEKWNGHLMNWYDTQTGQPLNPRYVSTVDSGNFAAYLIVVHQALAGLRQREVSHGESCQQLMEKLDAIINGTDFTALYNPDDRLFCLGFHVDDNRRETILYDLLASEARQASFVAIALGQIPVSHWFVLARTMTVAGGYKTLLSWSGTMFEYLMPSLIMRTYPNTVWDSTYEGVVHRQRAYAEAYGVPYGISESGYYAFDFQLNYQYRAFGVPGLGLDRGLERHLVVAPYATILSIPYAGAAAIRALRRLESLGAHGEFGFHEAVDFTKDRLPAGSDYEVIKSFMAHHQGMSLLTLTNLLLGDVMIDRFHAHPCVRAAELLLQERVPVRAALIETPIGLNARPTIFDDTSADTVRQVNHPEAIPQVNVLSGNRLCSVTTSRGDGWLIWNGKSVTRWHEDPVLPISGPALYIHNVAEEQTWSPSWYPCQSFADVSCEFRLHRSTFTARRGDIESQLSVTVAPDVDAEVRRLELVNHGNHMQELEITSYVELALATQGADNAHPAFNKLFVQTSHDEAHHVLLAKRRPRDEKEEELWAVHTLYQADADESDDYEFETDRAAFIGRGYTLAAPSGVKSVLRGSTGSVADPAFAMRRRVQLAPHSSTTMYIITGVAQARDAAIALVEQLQTPAQAQRAFHTAWVRSQIDLRHYNLSAAQALSAARLAARLLLPAPLSRFRAAAITQNTLGQTDLWSLGISGDAPIMTISVTTSGDMPFASSVVRQHQYLCGLGLGADLVFLDDTESGYVDALMHQLRDSLAARGVPQIERVIGLKGSNLSEEQRTLLQAVSRVWIRADGPSLAAQLSIETDVSIPVATVREVSAPADPHLPQRAGFGEYFNGYGAFIEDGRAYQIQVEDGAYLPRPWSNVIANPSFGFLVTELGTGYTWWRNAQECKVTPWRNDPVLDAPGEALYLHDVDTGEVWSATPRPAGDGRIYKVTHRIGSTEFEQTAGDITHDMELFVPMNDPVKIMRLRLSNRGKERKKIGLTYYAEWVLGVQREAQAPYIVSDWDLDTATLLAENRYQGTFRDATAFLHIGTSDRKAAARTREDSTSATDYAWTTDRAEFLGWSGTRARPAALYENRLSGRLGPSTSSCGAVRMMVELEPDEDREVLVLLGCADSKQTALELVRQYRDSEACDSALEAVTQQWMRITQQIQVKTPDRSMDLLLNGWLLYQALSSRVWGRTAFYQAGGAFGFRDQLQDAIAFLHTDASITREQILRNAAHQYQEGDVQHWWHEETKKGIRTRISDDLLWLPYAVSRYVDHTGDLSLLDVRVPFLHSEPLKDDEAERYEDTVTSDEQGTVLEHCLRAIRHTLGIMGEHGLPLMGTGDWNDGMNLVGAKGRGESVWLGWFLLDILKRFVALADEMSSEDANVSFADVSGSVAPSSWHTEFAEAAESLAANLNEHAWDGAWFRRAFTDAGFWLGSIADRECRIDAIAQSWAIISQGTTLDRQQRAMKSFDRELVDRQLGLAKLLTQAFDTQQPSPGYIQGYPPGIRENGGQYTHGVIWSIVAWAMLGQRDKAHELFMLLNPIHHTETPREVQAFGNEPYVMTADIYTAAPHEGRAGWSWYTGAAGWMYQAGVEYVLGIRRRADRLYVTPCVPLDWASFAVRYRFGETMYDIEVRCEGSTAEPQLWIVDGRQVDGAYLTLVDDGAEHRVTVYLSRERLTTVG